MAEIIRLASRRAGRGAQAKPGALELWGGYECTVNRVRDQWFDQSPRNGHEHRISDLELFADLGMRSLRYPAIWERMSPGHPDVVDFRWTDERLPRLRELGLNPILTLCHHGSGPHYTSLIQDSFAPGLARHAAAVAQRYPWVRDYTPVNEILTTARFSALYGYWYPHTEDEGLFWTALLNEVDATRLAMREIRKVNPEARLIATDDLGYCHATEPLQDEADYQNERRWMGWDLLCGMVKPGHALYERVAAFGLRERLAVIADDPCPPDVIGVNHYLASERLLDHRIELHPGPRHRGSRARRLRRRALCRHRRRPQPARRHGRPAGAAAPGLPAVRPHGCGHRMPQRRQPRGADPLVRGGLGGRGGPARRGLRHSRGDGLVAAGLARLEPHGDPLHRPLRGGRL
jgi:dTDP-4-dehydrorhamnose reductase